jgi:hypothetical protein
MNNNTNKKTSTTPKQKQQQQQHNFHPFKILYITTTLQASLSNVTKICILVEIYG